MLLAISPDRMLFSTKKYREYLILCQNMFRLFIRSSYQSCLEEWLLGWFGVLLPSQHY